MAQITQSLQPGQVLTVTADASSNGSVLRLADSAGGEPFAPIPVAASTSVVIGPFPTARRYAVQSDNGLLSYAFSQTAAAQPDPITTMAADGAIQIVSGTVKFTKGSAIAATLAAPRADQEGTIIKAISQSAFAHVITATGLLDDGVAGGSKNTATFAAFVGAAIVLEAVGLKWSVVSLKAVTVP